MKTFIASMALVTISILLIATLKTEPKVDSRSKQPANKILNSLSAHFSQPKKIESNYTTTSSKSRVSTKVRGTTPGQMAKKLGAAEKLEVKNVSNKKSFSVTAKDLKRIAPGTYVAKYNNKYYKIKNVRKVQ